MRGTTILGLDSQVYSGHNVPKVLEAMNGAHAHPALGGYEGNCPCSILLA
jgi:hypothetical protein